MVTVSSTGGRGRRNHGWVYEDVVDAAASGWTALEYYARRYRHSSAPRWRRRLEAGQVRRLPPAAARDRGAARAAAARGFVQAGGAAAGDEGQVVGPDTLLRGGDRLRYRRPPWTEPPAPRSFAVLHDDGHVLAVAKPAGLQVLPAAGFLENTLLDVVRQKRGRQWAPAHRLGRGTSGIVLFAASAAARRQLAAAWREGAVRKVYRALVQGTDLPAAFSVQAPIGPVEDPRLGTVFAARPAGQGRASVSHVRLLERREAAGACLVEVEIPTGRPHQIRIHLAWSGHPLVGEPLYLVGGQPRAPVGHRPALPGDVGYHLHALRVACEHPVGGGPLVVACMPPPILRRPAAGGTPRR